ncbi:MAG: hypothetical protein EA388_08810 [Nitriliruptor sp.]|nr:MAG: hypothetical protein EA388_08810 [Nitriliruptor sp.]
MTVGGTPCATCRSLRGPPGCAGTSGCWPAPSAAAPSPSAPRRSRQVRFGAEQRRGRPWRCRRTTSRSTRSAEASGSAGNTVMRAVLAAAELVRTISPVRVGIDETVMTTGKLTTRRRQFLTALVCLDTPLVVAVAQGRDTGSAATLLAEHAPDAKVVACDLFSGFKSAADTLEDAVVVADVFHLVRLGLTALDEVRRRRQQEIHGHRGHQDDPLFRLRRVLRVGRERLDDTVVVKIFDRLRGADTDDEVAAAWIAVDLLRRMYQAPDRDTAHRRLVTFYEWAVTVDVPEITRMATTIHTWQDGVLAVFGTRASNAPTKSANAKIKSIRRAA